VSYKGLVGAILVIVVLCGTLVSCGSTVSGGKSSEFEVIRQAADAYLSSGKASQTILGKDLHDIITDDNKKNDPRILEVRDFAQHLLGHICDAVNAPWRQLFLTLTPDKLDSVYFADLQTDNKQIVVYSYTGQEGGGQTTAFLNMMGYDAINLKWGYNVWQFCPNASPGAFIEASSGFQQVTIRSMVGFNAVGQNYPTETTVDNPDKTYKFPKVENTKSDDPWEIIRAAAEKWSQTKEPLSAAELAEGGAEQKHFFIDTEINPADLLALLSDTDPRNDPFILSVQPRDLYDRGHIQGAIWMPITEICKPENLQKLPPNQQIVVVSNDGQSGSQVAGILNILGYNALNLKFGMTAWTRNEDVAPGRFCIWTPEGYGVTFKDVLAYNVCWIDIPPVGTLPPIEGWKPPVLAPVEESADF